jgi:hypothetical protein
VEFLTDEQVAAFGRFAGATTRADLDPVLPPGRPDRPVVTISVTLFGQPDESRGWFAHPA